MKKLSALSFFLIASFCLSAQALWTCDGKTIIALGGDFFLNHTQLGDTEITLEALPLPNFGAVNGIAYRRTDDCIYGVDANGSGLRIFRLTPFGEYEVIRDLPGIEGPLFSGAISYDGRYLILSRIYQLFKIDLEDLSAPIETIQIGEGDGHPFADIALDMYTGKLHGYDLWTQQFLTLDPNTGLIENQYLLDPNPMLQSVPGMSFADHQVAIGTHGNFDELVMKFFHPQTRELLAEATSILPDGEVSEIDACSCPDFELSMLQTIRQDTVQHCQTVLATILLSQPGEDAVLGGPLTLVNVFPPGVLIDDIVHNPYAGTVQGVGTSELLIENFVPKFGVDSIVLRLAITEGAELGPHHVQASIEGLLDEEEFLMGVLLSDNPNTYTVEPDRTPFFIVEDDRLHPVVQDLFYRCPDQPVTLAPLAELAAYEVVWDDGSDQAERIVDAAGMYALTVTDLCNSYEVDIAVQDVYLEVELGDDQTIPLTTEVLIEAEIDTDFPVEEYRWYVNDLLELECEMEPCGQFSFVPEESSWVELVITEENGCTASDRVLIHPKLAVFVPNAFSPNGDGANDIFYPQTPDQLSYLDFQIFNRWGGLVFADELGFTNDQSSGWDGTFQGEPLETGIYIWKITLEVRGEPRTTAGDVMLVR